MPPPRPANGRNPSRVRADADSSKKQVAINRKEQQSDWQRRLAKDGPKIDRSLADMSKLAKEIAAMEKRREDTKKALERFVKMLEGALKEVKTFKEVPVPGKLPEMPKNTIALVSLLPVLLALIAWWALAKKSK